MSNYGVADHPEKDLMQEMWTQGYRAKAIVEELEKRGLPSVKKTTLARYGQRYWSDPSITIETDDAELEDLQEAVKAIEDMHIGQIKKISVATKNVLGWDKQEDGTNVQVEKGVTSHTIEVIPEDRDTSDNFEIQTFPFQIKIPNSAFPSKNEHLQKNAPEKPEGFHLAVSFPDTQMGFYRGTDGLIHTIHDEQALDVAYKILTFLDTKYGVDLIVNLGDDLDFAEFSTHRTLPGYKNLLKNNLSRHHTHLAIQREACPNARLVQIQGNHEARLEKFLTEKAPELLGLTRVNEDEPVISIPSLCRYDELDVESYGAYPRGVFWANDYLKFVHGTAASSIPGGAAGKTLSKSNGVSVVYGHDHYQAVVYDRVETRDGMRPVFAGSGGTLARLDGMVPSATGGISPTGRLVSKERWQQGILAIWYETDGLQRSYCEPVQINNGFAIYGGETFASDLDPNGQYNGK